MSPAEEGIRAARRESAIQEKWGMEAMVFSASAAMQARAIRESLAEVEAYFNDGELLAGVGTFDGLQERMTELAVLIKMVQREAAKKSS